MPCSHRAPLALCLLLSFLFSWADAHGKAAPTARPPASPKPSPSPVPLDIRSQLKPEVYRRVMEERQVMTNAKLENVKKGDPDLKEYSFYGAMLVRASLSLTRSILTNYPLYAQMIPYIDKALYDPKQSTVLLEGGIFKFKLSSRVQFSERGDRAIRYQIVGGHLRGLEGDILFESQGEKGTLVYFRGSLLGKSFAPAFIMERGAEIVFGLTGDRMRSYIESQKKGEPSHDPEIPQPRSRLETR